MIEQFNYYNNSGVYLHTSGRINEAVLCYCYSLVLLPSSFEANVNLGVAWQGIGQYGLAYSKYRQAIVINHNYAPAYNNIGLIFLKKSQNIHAEVCFLYSILFDPSYREAYVHYGNMLAHKRSDPYLTKSTYLRAAYLKPDDAEAHWNLSIFLLIHGDYQEAWCHFEWRWKREANLALQRPYQADPVWTGQDTQQGTILVWSEQGLGDCIQLVRYLGMVKARGWKIVLEVPRPLVRLMSQLHGIEVIAQNEPLPPFDVQCSLFSLPAIFATSLATIPQNIPYLDADPERVAFWRGVIGETGFRIGIIWQGNPLSHSEKGRSAPLKAFAPLSAVAGVRLISLQKVHGLEQLATLPEGMTVEKLDPDFDLGEDAFLDTMAIMQNLDLIVTVDTATGHLGGAMGRPVWLALQLVPHWVWMLEGRDTPWYTNTQLFRQCRDGDWEAVFIEMAQRLKEMLSIS